MLRPEDESGHSEHRFITLLRRRLPISKELHGERFTIREAGRRLLTPLGIALLSIEAMDLVFAVDSIPAVLASSSDTFVIYTSNAFAILGLRSLYFLLAGKVTGLAVAFKQGLALAGWSSMPGILASLLGIYGTLSMTPQTFIDALSYTTLDPMLVQLAVDSPWKGLAGSFSFLFLWSIGLAALGWKLWSRGGWGAAISIAALPYALVFGFQAVKALLA